ncbi:MAG: thioredoxin domain-containing protein, partial [Planctomycetales bacterium]
WPEKPRMGLRSFPSVLEAVHEAWIERRDQALEHAQGITQSLGRVPLRDEEQPELSATLLKRAALNLDHILDPSHGGFGSAPKFPHTMDLRLLLRIWKRDANQNCLRMAELTLDKMAGGGIYDHLGGGFHRYSVDAKWLVPHFEKMLYDNALLTRCYVEIHQATGELRHARTARETLDYVLREMTDPQGGFYSTQDADSEGVEGKFYVWSSEEIDAALGETRGATFRRVYDVTDGGNFEGDNILNLPKPIELQAKILARDPKELRAELSECREILLRLRGRRVAPGLDDKVIVSWTAMTIDAMAHAAGPLGQPKYLDAANKAADFVLTDMVREDGRLLHCWRAGEAKLDAYLDDYAYLIDALVTLHEASFDERRIDQAARLAEIVMSQFHDAEQGGFFFTAADAAETEQLPVRPKDFQDASVPSGTAMAATALLRLGKLTGQAEWLKAAERALQSHAAIMSQAPSAVGQMLCATDFLLGPTRELVLLGDPADPAVIETLAAIRSRFLPNTQVALRDPAATNSDSASATSTHLDRLFHGKQPGAESPTLFICENFACQAPAVGKQAVLDAIKNLDVPANA